MALRSPTKGDRSPLATQQEARIALIQDAVLTLGGRTALNSATLSLQEGEIYVLVGPNGSGKTSLVRALCGRVPLDSGHVEIGHELLDPRRASQVLQLIGYVPQSIAVFQHLTVRENLEVFSRLMNARPSEASINGLLAITRLAEERNSIVATLSGGLQRRVNIAVALAADPRLLLLDEPTVGIDLDGRQAIHRVLGDLRERGVAILLITHDFDQADQLADKVGFMSSGTIILEGRPADALRQAFGSSQQIDVVLASDVQDRAKAELQALGFEPVDGHLLWRALADERQGPATALENLRSGHFPVHEIRIREPGLDTLFWQITRSAAS